ncbi:E3 ubiquitin/ISG15 ligase TRIM25-like [Chanos chanos]|uniref:E3 ubiquitin/ISG15 ligase TRIM25-like n=1 Tax=Chanos chanos TaxID=29144 RepID=A0A6J2USQ6_CHACN|nr:E3 ubiquitin/ISG15 ligase TRIM25-like [Chanos chanos]
MAEASSVQDSLICPVCLDLFKDPVTIPCGHSYCMSCIKDYWDQDDQRRVYSCPQCRQIFTPRPVLKKSTTLAELAEKLRKTRLQAAPPAVCYAGPGDVECDMCTGRKLKAVKSCLVCLVSFCETHLQPHHESPAYKKHKLIKASTQLQDRICSQHDKVVEIYCRTDQKMICYLCTMDEHKGHDTVSAAAERSEKQRRLEEKYPENSGKCFQSLSGHSGLKESPNMAVNPVFSFEHVRKSVSEMKKSLEKILSKETVNISKKATKDQLLAEPKTRAEYLQYSCQLTLDRNTANVHLCLSEGNREVTGTRSAQPYPDHPERFDWWMQVLCREGLSGRCYWEVEWSGRVFIGVSYRGISRKGEGNECGFGYNNQSWSLDCSYLSYTFIHNDIKTIIPNVSSCSRIGVYLDHRAGTLSFYSVSDTMTLLHRVQTTFTQPLYAGFWLNMLATVQICN